jgi:hypothetical protein
MYSIIQDSLSQEIKIEKIIKKDNHMSVKLSLGLDSSTIPSGDDFDVRIMLSISEPGEGLTTETILEAIRYPGSVPDTTVERFKLKPNSTFIYATETKKYYNLGEIKLDLNDEIFNDFKGIYLYAYETRTLHGIPPEYHRLSLTVSEFIIKKEVGERPIAFNDSPRSLNSSIINGQNSIFDNFKKLESSVKTLKLPAFSDLQIATSNENLNIGFFVNIKNIILNQFSFLNNTQNKGVADMVTFGAEEFITEVNLIERKSGSTSIYRLTKTDLPSMEMTRQQRSGLLYYTFSKKIDSFSKGIESKFEVEISLRNSFERILLEGIKPSILFLDRFVYIIEDMSNNDVFYDFANDRYINLNTIASTLARDLQIPTNESISVPQSISSRLGDELDTMLNVLKGFGVNVDDDTTSTLRKSVFFSEDYYPTRESVSLFIQAYQSTKKLYKKIFNENNILFNFPNLSQGFGNKNLGTNFKYPIYKIQHSFSEVFRPEEHDVKLSYFSSTVQESNFSSIDIDQYRRELDNKIKTYFNISQSNRLRVNSDISDREPALRKINIDIYNSLSPSNIKVKNKVLVDLFNSTEWREQYYNVAIIRLLDYILFKHLELDSISISDEELKEKLKLNTYRLLSNLNTGLGRPKVLADISQNGALGADDLATGDDPPPVIIVTTAEDELTKEKKKASSGGSSSDSVAPTGGSKKSDETYSRADYLFDTGKDTFTEEEVIDTPAEENEIIANADFLLNLINAVVQEGGEIFSSFKYNETLRNKEEFLRSIRSRRGGRTLPFPLYSLYENLQSEVQSVSSRANFSFTEIENAIYLSMIRLRFSNIVKVEKMTGFETMPSDSNLLNLKKITYTEIDEDFINNSDSGDFICKMVKYSPGDTNSLWYVNNNNLLNFNIENNIFRIIK